MKKTVIFEGGVNKVSTLADGTLSINIHTQELPDDTMMRIFGLRKSPGMVLISSDDISKAEQEEVEKFTTDFEVGKNNTASQILRAVLLGARRTSVRLSNMVRITNGENNK